MSFLSQYGSVIIFYALVIILIYANRKRFDFPAKLIAMYRTKIGIKTMERWGKKAERLIKILAIIGVIIGFIGMAATVYLIIDGLYKLIFVPSAPATFAPIIPGVKIPGVEIFVPFWYGIIALFLTIVVHEFSHGVVAEAYRMRVKHSGVGMMGPFPMAFVEPDEKQLTKAKTKAQLSVYAAGPFSNILLTIILILLFGFLPLFVAAAGGTPSEGLLKFTKHTSIIDTYSVRQGLYEPTGLKILTVANDSGAQEAGLPPGTIITAINGEGITHNLTAFTEELVAFQDLKPNQTITLGNENDTYTITTKPWPENRSKGRIGITFDTTYVTRRSPQAMEKYGNTGITLFEVLFQQVFWLILLSSGIGLANLLPLGPVDGGRMLLAALEARMEKKRAQRIWGQVSAVTFVAVILLVVVPIIRNIIGF